MMKNIFQTRFSENIKRFIIHSTQFRRNDNFAHLFAAQLFILSILLGTIYTINGYTFGLGNQTEDLPKIFRVLDTTYLINDHFVNSSAKYFSIRFYFTNLMAIAIKTIGVNLSFFIMTVIPNILILYISSLISIQLFKKSSTGYICIFLIYFFPNFYNLAGGYGLLSKKCIGQFYLFNIFIFRNS